jgi:hypothetical protein
MKSMSQEIKDCFASLAMTLLGTFYETINLDDLVKSRRRMAP